MSVVEVDQLTSEISAEAPSGADVEFDPAYFELEKLAQGTPESVMGDEVKPGEEPDWREVKTGALALFERTRDMRVAMILAVALLKEDGVAGFRDGLGVVRAIIEKLWEHFYPKLDPEDNNDPTLRVNVLKGLDGDGSATDVYKFKLRLREATLTNSPQKIGKFGFRDIQIARGKFRQHGPKMEKEGQAPDIKLINAAFEDTSTDDLQATQTALQESIDHLTGIDGALAEKAGPGIGPDLSGLKEVAGLLQATINEQLSKRGVGSPATDSDGGGSEAVVGGNSGGGGGRGGVALTGEIGSRADVVRVLDKICEYYERFEPASPVPMFMTRAKRLVTMSFVDVIKDLAPDAMARIEVFTGSPDGSSGESPSA